MDLSLYLVKDPHLGGRDIVETVVEAVAGGVTVVQVRDKEASDAEVADLTTAILDKVDVPVFVNDRLAVAQRLGCHLHVGQDDVPFLDARKLLHDDQMIGLSVGSHEELDAVEKIPGRKPDLLGLGPIFSTTTKADAPPGLGTELVDQLARRAGDIPTVAIGRINPSNAGEVAHTAVDGICVVSAIMAAEDPRLAAQTLLTKFKEK